MAPKVAAVETCGRHVRDPREADGQVLVEQSLDVAVRIGRADAADDGRVLDDRQEPAAELERDPVRVAVGEVAGERTLPVHPERSGVVGHQNVDARAVRRLRDEAGPRAAEDERLAARSNGAQPLENLGPRELPHRERL